MPNLIFNELPEQQNFKMILVQHVILYWKVKQYI